MAPSYIVSLIAVLAQVLPLIGINVGSEALTTTAQTIVAIAAGLFVMWRQLATRRSTIAGKRPV